MSMIVLALVGGAHQAEGLVRALKDGGFALDEMDVGAGPLTALVSRGVPEEEAPVYAEAIRRGGMLVCVCAGDEEEAAEAAEIMSTHGAVDIEECATRWRNDRYAVEFGEYPAAPGRIYHDPRARATGGRYDGPERRVRDEPYAGTDRRAI